MKKPKSNIAIIICFIIFFGLAGVGIYYGMAKGSSEKPQTTPTQSDMNTQLQTTITKEGTGAGAVAGQTITVNYTGKLSDGTVFDSNVDPKFAHVEPFEFTLGNGDVITGWDQGLLGMKVGEYRTLVIPPALGYGEHAIGLIPANATLIFDVELLSIK